MIQPPSLSTCSLVLFLILAWIPCSTADSASGDESSSSPFISNLVTALAPLLFLFGEKATKQFLSHAESWDEVFIFAMGPVGIVTAVVSSIRIAGPNWLRAVVGRARESKVQAQAELLSATSAEVCELWGREGIVRLLGKPDLKELVFTNLNTPGNKDVFDLVEGWRREVIKPNNGDRYWIKEARRLAANAPNLSLNLATPVRAASAKLRPLSILGVALQLGVLVFDAAIVYKLRWTNSGVNVPDYAFPMTAVGTIFVCCGMMVCAYVYKESVENETWVPTDPAARIVWLQKAQDVGSQQFDAVGIFSEITAHSKIRTSRPRSFLNLAPSVYFATLACILGFAVQLIGLHAMHFSATVAQLIITFVMTGLRTLLRLNLVYTPSVKEVVSGSELDWLAIHITGFEDWEISRFQSSNSPPAVRPENYEHPTILSLRNKLSILTKWDTAVSPTALALARAIERSLNLATDTPHVARNNFEYVFDTFHWSLDTVASKLSESGTDSSVADRVWLSLSRVNHEARSPRSVWAPWVFGNPQVQTLKSLLSLWTYSFKAKEYAVGNVVSDSNPQFIFVLGPESRWLKIYWQWIAREGKRRRWLNPVVVQPGDDWTEARYSIYTASQRLQAADRSYFKVQHSVGLESPHGDAVQHGGSTEGNASSWFVGYSYQSPISWSPSDLPSNREPESLDQLLAIVHAQHIYAGFLSSLVQAGIKIISAEERPIAGVHRYQEEGSDVKQLTNSFFSELAEIFVDCGLGTEEEAYVCILSAFEAVLPK